MFNTPGIPVNKSLSAVFIITAIISYESILYFSFTLDNYANILV